jgi:invasion protein IalB
MRKARRLRLVTLLVLWAANGAASAETATPPQARSPQRTTATYDDWVVRCEILGPAKTCEMAQATQIQGQSQPITQIAIGQQSKGVPMKIVFEVPINVWLPAGVKLVLDEKDPAIATVYGRCLPTACLADTDLRDDQITKLRAMVASGKLEFKDAAQRDISIPVSFKGFEQAYQALLQP